jgi:hypothetical protein
MIGQIYTQVAGILLISTRKYTSVLLWTLPPEILLIQYNPINFLQGMWNGLGTLDLLAFYLTKTRVGSI